MSTPRVLELHSPYDGSEPLIYEWPLKKSASIDEAADILESMRMVMASFSELRVVVAQHINFDTLDRADYDSMTRACQTFNKAANAVRTLWRGATRPEHQKNWAQDQQKVLRLIVTQIAYNRAVVDVQKLNRHYEAFSSQTYGETTFDRVQSIIDEVKFRERDVFVDLGSGVGQVVVHMAGASKCKKIVGIEIAKIPADYAETLGTEFTRWMKWFGRKVRPFELIKGDFLDNKYRDLITKEATVLFINNFAFTADLEERIRSKILCELNHGVRVISTRPYCSMNTRLSDRTSATDLAAIMDVRQLTPVSQPTSWTCNHVDYYVHTVNRHKLERYFSDKKHASMSPSPAPSGKCSPNNGAHAHAHSLAPSRSLPHTSAASVLIDPVCSPSHKQPAIPTLTIKTSKVHGHHAHHNIRPNSNSTSTSSRKSQRSHSSDSSGSEGGDRPSGSSRRRGGSKSGKESKSLRRKQRAGSKNAPGSGRRHTAEEMHPAHAHGVDQSLYGPTTRRQWTQWVQEQEQNKRKKTHRSPKRAGGVRAETVGPSMVERDSSTPSPMPTEPNLPAGAVSQQQRRSTTGGAASAVGSRSVTPQSPADGRKSSASTTGSPVDVKVKDVKPRPAKYEPDRDKPRSKKRAKRSSDDRGSCGHQSPSSTRMHSCRDDVRSTLEQLHEMSKTVVSPLDSPPTAPAGTQYLHVAQLPKAVYEDDDLAPNAAPASSLPASHTLPALDGGAALAAGTVAGASADSTTTVAPVQQINQLSQQHTTGPVGGALGPSSIPELNAVFARMVPLYEEALRRMANGELAEEIEEELQKEAERKQRLQARHDALERQVRELLAEGVCYLKARMGELGMEADTPAELMRQSKELVVHRKDLGQQHERHKRQLAKLEQFNRVKDEAALRSGLPQQMGVALPENVDIESAKHRILEEITQNFKRQKSLLTDAAQLEQEVNRLMQTLPEHLLDPQIAGMLTSVVLPQQENTDAPISEPSVVPLPTVAPISTVGSAAPPRRKRGVTGRSGTRTARSKAAAGVAPSAAAAPAPVQHVPASVTVPAEAAVKSPAAAVHRTVTTEASGQESTKSFSSMNVTKPTAQAAPGTGNTEEDIERQVQSIVRNVLNAGGDSKQKTVGENNSSPMAGAAPAAPTAVSSKESKTAAAGGLLAGASVRAKKPSLPSAAPQQKQSGVDDQAQSLGPTFSSPGLVPIFPHNEAGSQMRAQPTENVDRQSGFSKNDTAMETRRQQSGESTETVSAPCSPSSADGSGQAAGSTSVVPSAPVPSLPQAPRFPPTTGAAGAAIKHFLAAEQRAAAGERSCSVPPPEKQARRFAPIDLSFDRPKSAAPRNP